MYWDHVRNYVRSNIVQSEENGPLFSWVDINPTELCNRTCEFCPRGENYPNQDLHMSLPIIEKISQDLHDVDFMGVVNICGNGEPLLSKNIYSLIESLSGYNVEMVTNGDTLSESIIEEIFNLGLSHLNVSCYDGEEQIDYFNGLFAGVGISSEWYTLREYWKPLPGLNNRAGVIDVGNSFVDKPCYYMHYSIQVDWNGDVLFCVQSVYNKSIIHGNIIGSSLKDIWFGGSMTKYRKKLTKGRKKFPCSSCNVNGTLFGEAYVS